ncbi:uncharacterized protein A1O9_00177 [Exophiala aquamarina CBS 119918]|uniref:N-acetyltransferase domain-containing protein n=1 Tax=Exophiala aquamarina CBS 119918 TaxID=1182545 RepID=A0A072Q2T0_9EURO|nr:uncharacterized protein A1O9_00177 [Exophiala aquamarina CBS 119918]KEF62205.1 hypothetical protein A1O9_00177 [Exophiala aquamarina CBS 119918]
MEGPAFTSENISVPSLAKNRNGPAGSQASLPPTTISTTEEYRYRLADIYSRASVSDALIALFEHDKDPTLTCVTTGLVHKACEKRIERKVALGSLIVEAANFAAVACWEPPAATPPMLSEGELLEIEKERPAFAQFTREIQGARSEVLGPEQKYWCLSLMARDPDRKDKGAVRAVIEPFVARARSEGVPLWLIAGNLRARDVYAYFGFRVVRYLESFPKERTPAVQGVPSWVMVCNWPAEGEGGS